MSTDATSDQTPMLEVTDLARQKILRVRAQDEEPERLALRLEVTGVAAGRYDVAMSFQLLADAGPDEAVVHHDDLSIVVPRTDVDKVRGATLDLDGDLEYGGIVLHNPNSPSPAVGAAPPVGDLSGDTAQRVMQVLDRQINPSIASHGGRAELVAVEDGTAYLRLGGGCQGCAMAQVTLTQGIVLAIKDAVPEITDVVDVTDHASGTNPYFESAKK